MKLSFTALKNFLPRYLHTLNDSPVESRLNAPYALLNNETAVALGAVIIASTIAAMVTLMIYVNPLFLFLIFSFPLVTLLTPFTIAVSPQEQRFIVEQRLAVSSVDVSEDDFNDIPLTALQIEEENKSRIYNRANLTYFSTPKNIITEAKVLIKKEIEQLHTLEQQNMFKGV